MMTMKLTGLHFQLCKCKRLSIFSEHVRSPIFLSISIFVQFVFGWCSRQIQSCVVEYFVVRANLCFILADEEQRRWTQWLCWDADLTCVHCMCALSCFIWGSVALKRFVSLFYVVFLTAVLFGHENNDLIIVFKLTNLRIKSKKKAIRQKLFSSVFFVLPLITHTASYNNYLHDFLRCFTWLNLSLAEGSGI